MDITNINDITDRSDFSIAVIDNNEIKFVTIQEGSGDNLTREDRDEGYVDYINYSEYKIKNNAIEEHDGGMELLTEFYADMSIEDIIERILGAVDADIDSSTIICLPYEADTAYFEDAAGIDMKNFNYGTYDVTQLDIYKNILAAIKPYVND